MRKNTKAQKEEKKDKMSIREKMEGTLEVPLHAISDTPCIEMIGNREFMIESCKGVIEYTQETVRISAGRYVIRLTGRGLTLTGMKESSLHVSGVITIIEFML